MTILRPGSPKAVEAIKIAIICGVICASAAKTEDFKPERRDLREVVQSGEIIIALPDSAPALFMYEGRAAGYEYELSKAFADSIGVKLKIVTFRGWPEMEEAIKKGDVDIAAPSLPLQAKNYAGINFSAPYVSVKQTILTNRDNQQKTGIKKNSTGSFQNSDETTCLSLNETASRIKQVAGKKTGFTVTSEHIAKNAMCYYPQLVTGESFGQSMGISLAVNSESKLILRKLNSFLYDFQISGNLETLDKKYFPEADNKKNIEATNFLGKLKSRLPDYRHIIQKEAKSKGFDWRLITAIIYQESAFNHRAEGGAGAAGLMQLLPSTAANLGFTVNLRSPASNVKAGVRYLKEMTEMFTGETESDRLSFALAAYNIGPNNIIKAKKVAGLKGLNSEKWAEVATILPLVKRSRFPKNARKTYCRAEITIDYVQKIMTYYEILKYREIKPLPGFIDEPSTVAEIESSII